MSEEQVIDQQEENRLVALRREKLNAIPCQRCSVPEQIPS